MSHFTVLVKLSADRLVKHNGNVEEAIAEMLAPYQENNMGDCPQDYMEFNDLTEEIKEKWETRTIEKVKLASGEVFGKSDPRFAVKDEHGYTEHKYPEDSQIIEIPAKEVYSDINEFAEEYCGYDFNEEKQAYGYWENPNAKWDWYQIGGRWTGLLPVIKSSVTKKNGSPGLMTAENSDENYADVVIVGELDSHRMDLDIEESIQKFWEKYQRYKRIKDKEIEPDKDDTWLEYEIDSTLSSLGIKRCVNHGVRGGDGKFIVEPIFETDYFTLQDLQTKYRWHWEFSTYAVLDDDGWHEKGQMGWWGMSSETVEEAEQWDKSFVNRFLKNEEDDTVLVVVDCHI